MPALTLRPPLGVPTRQPTHPGRFLARHYLGPLAISQSRAARLLGVSRRRMHELTQGQRAMSPDTAIRCALAFGTDAAFWLAMQAAWDNFHAWKVLRQQSSPAAQARGAHALPTRWVAPSTSLSSRLFGLK